MHRKVSLPLDTVQLFLSIWSPPLINSLLSIINLLLLHCWNNGLGSYPCRVLSKNTIFIKFNTAGKEEKPTMNKSPLVESASFQKKTTMTRVNVAATFKHQHGTAPAKGENEGGNQVMLLRLASSCRHRELRLCSWRGFTIKRVQNNVLLTATHLPPNSWNDLLSAS